MRSTKAKARFERTKTTNPASTEPLGLGSVNLMRACNDNMLTRLTKDVHEEMVASEGRVYHCP